ncbi:MAG: glycosyltransferase [Fibrobacterales bacterium]
MSNIIQTLWIGNPLSKLEQLCLTSFIKNGHEVHLYTYGDVGNVPEGVVVKDANEIVPQSEIFTYYKGSYAGFADWFRWEMLYKVGGYWVDTDMVCLKKFDFDNDEIVFGEQERDFICPAVLKFPKGHSFPRHMADRCQNPNAFIPYDTARAKLRKVFRYVVYLNDRSKIIWGETGGPYGVTTGLKYYELMDNKKPFTHFFPVHHNNWNTIFNETLKNDAALFTESYALHVWNEMSRNEKDFDKNGSFPQDSIFEQLKRKYGVA